MTVLVLTSWSTINVAKDQNVFACHVLQLQLESPYACASIATRCLLHFQTCGTYREPVLPCFSANSAALSPGDVVHRGMSQFLLAQASLLTTHQDRGHLDKQGGSLFSMLSIFWERERPNCRYTAVGGIFGKNACVRKLWRENKVKELICKLAMD